MKKIIRFIILCFLIIPLNMFSQKVTFIFTDSSNKNLPLIINYITGNDTITAKIKNDTITNANFKSEYVIWLIIYDNKTITIVSQSSEMKYFHFFYNQNADNDCVYGEMIEGDMILDYHGTDKHCTYSHIFYAEDGLYGYRIKAQKNLKFKKPK